MPKTAEELANSLMGILYSYVQKSTAGPAEGTADDPFVAWFRPGVPFEPEDFRFAKYMLVGQGQDNPARAADLSLQQVQASGFSRFIDFVPSASGVKEGDFAGAVLRPGEASLSKNYRRILDAALPAELPQPEGIQAKVDELVAKAEPLKAKYDDYQAKYEAARKTRIDAQTKALYDPMANVTYMSEGPGLEAAEVSAFQAWEIFGKKGVYEDIAASITALLASRSPAIWLEEAKQIYRMDALGRSATFGDARLTMPYPPSFSSSMDSWSTFSFATEHTDTLATSKSRKWSAGGGIGWGSFKLGGSGGGSTTQTLSISNTDNFEMNFSVTRVKLMRGWFDAGLLQLPYWKFKEGSEPAASGEVVSDGNSPPSGILIAYPTFAIFIGAITIKMAELADENSELVKTLKAEASGGWGFGVVNVGGSYESNSQERKSKHDLSSGTLTIPGMQLVGVECELIGRSPNPKDGLAWVGGVEG